MAIIETSSLNGRIKELVEECNLKLYREDNFEECMLIIDNIRNTHKNAIALDTETTSLTMFKDDNYILGYSLSPDNKSGYYFNSRLWSEEQHILFINNLNSLKNDKYFWNWSFDYGYSKAHYNVGLDATHDGMLWFHTLFTHRKLEKIKGTNKQKGYSLKELSSEFTKFGEYESELKNVKHKILFNLNKRISNKDIFDLEGFNNFCDNIEITYESDEEKYNVIQLMNKYILAGKVLKEEQFCYGFLPDCVLAPYADLDTICTMELTERCISYAKKMYNSGWEKVYEVIDIKHKATKLYSDASVRGFKVDRDYVLKLSNEWVPLREEALKSLMSMKEIKQAEKIIFRNKLIKEQAGKAVFDSSEFTKEKLSVTFRCKLTKAQATRKSILPLSRCRVIFKDTKLKFNNAKDRKIKSSKVSLNKCRDIYKNDKQFNFNSPTHKKILFIDLLKLKPLEFNKKDANGNKSAKLDGNFVSHYARLGYSFMEKVNTYMLYQKGISSFLGTDESSENGLWNTTSDEHPYNHSNFAIVGTITSRLATSKLNLSQFPSRGVLHEAKNCFVVEDNYKLFAFDFATSELRILGALSKEENFKKAFSDGTDLHSATALSIWKDKMDLDYTKSEKEILSELKNKYGETYRYFAKSINFSLPYGTTEVGLSKSIGVSKTEAKKYIDDYRKANKAIAKYIDWTKDHVMNYGYTEGSYGERLYLKSAKGYDWRESENSRNKNWAAISQYKKATNFIIQSDNAFMLYKSLITFFEEVKEKNLDVELIATIYDSMYIRVNKELDDKMIYNLMKKHFEVDFYGIPMLIDIGISLNEDKTYSHRWGNLREVKYSELDEIKEINKKI